MLCNTHCFPTATMVSRTRLNSSLHVHWLYCYKVNLFCTSLWRRLHVALLWYCQCSADSFTAKCYIWSIALHGAETWTFWAVDQKHVEGFEMWCWRRMERIIWTDRVRNEEELHRVKEQRNILHEIRKRNSNWIGQILRRNCILQQVIEGKVKGDTSDRKTRKKT